MAPSILARPSVAVVRPQTPREVRRGQYWSSVQANQQTAAYHQSIYATPPANLSTDLPHPLGFPQVPQPLPYYTPPSYGNSLGYYFPPVQPPQFSIQYPLLYPYQSFQPPYLYHSSLPPYPYQSSLPPYPYQPSLPHTVAQGPKAVIQAPNSITQEQTSGTQEQTGITEEQNSVEHNGTIDLSLLPNRTS